jgi:sugar lactone lactonase YvrE
MRNGEKNGELWEWHTGTGWKIIPGTESSGANGVEISKDGKWLYIAGWGDQTFTRVSRGQTSIKRDTVPLGFRVDNLSWMGDQILGGGQGGAAPNARSVVVKINPATMKVEPLIDYKDNETWGAGTTAVQVGNELWVGAIRGERIARFPLK